jgi:peptidoglycan/LPS O-acetylase OafA/YrhL
MSEPSPRVTASNDEGSPARTPALGDLAIGKRNHLNLIRMVAATLVLIAHAYPISLGVHGGVDLLSRGLGVSVGTVAVWVFFVISGFLIPASYQRWSLGRYLALRAARILPGLWVSVLFCIALGAVVSNEPFRQYMNGPRTWEYAVHNMTLFETRYGLPGVFTKNVYPNSVNGSLWTLPYEALLYVVVGLAGVLGLLGNSRIARCLFAAGTVAMLASPTDWPAADTLLRERFELLWPQLRTLTSCFLVGTAFWLFRHRIPISRPLVLIAAAGVAVCIKNRQYDTLFIPALSYLLLALAFFPKGPALKFNDFGDPSYGMYIYAFPVQQTVEFLWPQTGPLFNCLVAFPITLLLAVLSWRLVERPSLHLVRAMASRRIDPGPAPAGDHRP